MNQTPANSLPILDANPLLILFLFFLLPACGPHNNRLEDPDFESRKIYVISASSVEEAYQYRESILEGSPYPESLQIHSITDLDLIDPSLTKTAIQLDECEISDPIGLTNKDSLTPKFILIQRPKPNFRPCVEPGSSFSETLKNMEKRAGEIFLGLLLIGSAVFGLVSPFLFGVF